MTGRSLLKAFAAFPIWMSSSDVRLPLCDIVLPRQTNLSTFSREFRLLKMVAISFLSSATSITLVFFELIVRPTFLPFSSTLDVACCSLCSVS